MTTTTSSSTSTKRRNALKWEESNTKSTTTTTTQSFQFKEHTLSNDEVGGRQSLRSISKDRKGNSVLQRSEDDEDDFQSTLEPISLDVFHRIHHRDGGSGTGRRHDRSRALLNKRNNESMRMKSHFILLLTLLLV